MMDVFKSALERLLKAVYPNRCKRCGDVIELDDSFCSECLNIKRIEKPLCKNCGASKADCDCRNKKNEYKEIVAPFYYTDNITKAVYRLKQDMPFLAKQMAADIHDVIKEEYGDISFDYITYVPMTKRDFSNRGYNQSMLIAKELSRIIGIPFVDLLKKTEQTEQQKSKSARERKVNLFGVFDYIDKIDIFGKTILIVDDVKTTGSTLNECAKMLNLNDAEAVYAASFAVVKNNK